MSDDKATAAVYANSSTLSVDLSCTCGADSHFKGPMISHVRCPHCSKTYRLWVSAKVVEEAVEHATLAKFQYEIGRSA